MVYWVMLPLCPDAALSPWELKAVLVGHEPHALTTARLGTEYHNPLDYNWNHNAYVKTWVGERPPPTYEAAYRAIIFGEIAEPPVHIIISLVFICFLSS